MKSSYFLDAIGFAVLFGFVSSSNSYLGFYRGLAPGITGSLATGATYFGVIESSKKWIEESHPSLGGHWAHFIAGAIGKLSLLCPKFLSHFLSHATMRYLLLDFLTKFYANAFSKGIMMGVFTLPVSF